MKLPIEIIQYILDFVDIRSARRFTSVARSNQLDIYLEIRYKSMFVDVIKSVNSIGGYQPIDDISEGRTHLILQKWLRNMEYYEKKFEFGIRKNKSCSCHST